MGTFTLHTADCVDAMRRMPEASVDAVVTDPPYGLEFMGKDWDAPWKEQARAESATVVDPAAVGGFQDGDGGNAFSRSRVRTDTRRHGGDMQTANQGFQAWSEAWAREALRVLKPGGHLLAFGGSRTYHRLASAVEDAGFEMRDTIMWLYGSGFPKSHDVSKAIDKQAGNEREVTGARFGGRCPGGDLCTCDTDGRTFSKTKHAAATAPGSPAAAEWDGWGTALKPAHEPVVVARKPFKGTLANNVLAHRTGALNIKGCRIDLADGETVTAGLSDPANREGVVGQAWQAPTDVDRNQQAQRESLERANLYGRWPANVVFDAVAAAILDEQTGVSQSPEPRMMRRGAVSGSSFGGVHGKYGGAAPHSDVVGYGDAGGASRFFKVCKEDPCEPATIAEGSSVPVGTPAGSALGAAATPAHPGGALPSDSPVLPSAPSTSGTPSVSEMSGDGATRRTPSTGDGSPPGTPPEEPSLSPSHARSADDQASGTTTTTTSRSRSDGDAESTTSRTTPPSEDHGDPGSRRFMYAPKASRVERNAGLEDFDTSRKPQNQSALRGEDAGLDPVTERFLSEPMANVHPTVKPIDVMRWLIRLVTPPGGVVLDPFMGSGTTGCAAMLERVEFVGVEREQEYADIAAARISWWNAHPDGMELVARVKAEEERRERVASGQLELFG